MKIFTVDNFKEKKNGQTGLTRLIMETIDTKPNKLVGLGPYQITEWETGSYIIASRKDNWWGDDDTLIYNQNYPEQIIFKIITG